MPPGYIVSPPYEETYAVEASLPWIRLALLDRGIDLPGASTACEIGFGQGLSLAIHAAASPGTWYGTDINPEHLAAARTLVDAAGVSAVLSDEPIGAFAARRDLPDFDLVVMNGVWSWVSEETRGEILRFVQARLRPGGVFLLDYIVLPGWAPFLPLRELLAEIARSTAGRDRPLLDSVAASVGFAERLLDAAPAYLEAYPRLREELSRLGGADRRNLAHDLFNTFYAPMTFLDSARRLGGAGLRHAGLADLGKADTRFLTERQRELLASAAEGPPREYLRDIVVNRHARREYWVREPVRLLSARERQDRVRQTSFIALVARPAFPPRLRALLALHPAGPTEAVYRPLLEAFEPGRAVPFAELERIGSRAGADFRQVLDTVELAISEGQVRPMQDEAHRSARGEACRRLNDHLLARAIPDGALELASAVTGGGIRVGDAERGWLRGPAGSAPAPGVAGRERHSILEALGIA